MSPIVRSGGIVAERTAHQLDVDLPDSGDVILRGEYLARVLRVKINYTIREFPGPNGRSVPAPDGTVYLEYELIDTARLEHVLAELIAYSDVTQHRTYEVEVPREWVARQWLRTDAGRQWLAEWLAPPPGSPVPDSHSNVVSGRGGRI